MPFDPSIFSFFPTRMELVHVSAFRGVFYAILSLAPGTVVSLQKALVGCVGSE